MGLLVMIPDQSFQDYPSALTYAGTIFIHDLFFPDMNVRDLIFLINMNPTTTTTPVVPVVTPVVVTKS